MLKTDEIFYFNKALGGTNIYGFDFSNMMADMIKEKKSTEIIRNNLINKGLLNSDGSLNNISFNIIRNLEIYKNSKKYIYLNSLVGSIDDNGFVIMFDKNSNDEFNIRKTPKELMLLALVKNYDFLQEYIDIEEKEEKIALEEITEILLKIHYGNAIYIKLVDDNKVSKYNIYFKQDDKVYKYNVMTEKITLKNPKNIRIEIAEILGCKEG